MHKRALWRFFSFILIIFYTFGAMAQTAGSSFDDTMRSHNKIYVVLAVCLVILVVFILYLIRIDRKISKLEDKDEDFGIEEKNDDILSSF